MASFSNKEASTACNSRSNLAWRSALGKVEVSAASAEKLSALRSVSRFSTNSRRALLLGKPTQSWVNCASCWKRRSACAHSSKPTT